MLVRSAVAGLLLVFAATAVDAQVRVVTGRVIDAKTGEPVESPNVSVVGTQIGTIGTEGGTFLLRDVPAGDVVLLVRRIGYRRREVQLPAGRTEVTIELDADVLRLEGVVVTGQVTGVERRNLANAVTTVTAEDLDRAPAETIERTLQGKVPGANIQANSSAPGGGMQVELRGITSFIGGSPLYVVDGVIVSDVAIQSNIDAVTDASGGSNPSREQDNPVNRIADLNPADIETIEILKGASAAAIYGSKASNGVIIITTKRGRSGPAQVDVSQRFGFFDLAKTLTRRFADAAEVDAVYGAGTAASYDFDPNRNWEEDLAGRNPLSFETSARVTGGDANTRYFLSGLWKNDEGVIENNGFEKQSLRVNVDHRFSDRVDIQVSTNLSRTLSQRGISGNDNTGTSPYFAGAFTPRFVDLTQDPDGTFPDNPFAQSNPIQTMALLTNDEEVWRFVGSTRLHLGLLDGPRHSLDLIGVGGIDRFSQDNVIHSPAEMQYEDDDGLPGTAALGTAASEFLNLSANLVHTYRPSSQVYTATTSTGIQYDTRDLNIARVVTRNLVQGQANIDQGATLEAEQTRSRQEDFGLYLQEEVLVRDRLLLTFGVRGDQTSSATDDSKIFWYPKAAASYRWSLGGLIEELKVRGAYGESGKQPLYSQKFTPLDGSVRIEGLLGFQIEGSTATEVKPERQKELELGVDATLFGGRANLEATVYHRSISDFLFTRSLAPSTGFAREIFNGGSARVRGVEAALTLVPVESDALSWIFRSTFGLNRSKITDLPVPDFIPEPGQAGFVFGAGIGAYFIEEGASATQIIGNLPQPDGSGALGKVGDSNPDFRVGFTNDLTWGSWNLFTHWDWQQGSQIINLTRLLFDLGGNSADCTTGPEDPCGDRLSRFGTDLKSTYIEDASFLKLREITLSWNVPDNVRQGIWGALRHARLSVSARNALVFTGYAGMDPEVSNFGTQAVGRNVDVVTYPRTRSFWFGIDLGF
jgi:TonB-linked SusC/RagA family outer membrane protein